MLGVLAVRRKLFAVASPDLGKRLLEPFPAGTPYTIYDRWHLDPFHCTMTTGRLIEIEDTTPN